ncbi:MAG: cobyrinate a,c-diamide synthase [Roseofilum sp. SBFL]|uniref:cobyrinate a,c-diamide synthase n=1 Tax=unclassified Roseofilum TaxID=2620099 RepID=UPI001B1C4587|nr:MULTISPECIES: cobyrinate a,c-diamide synthase [unclassified Roseofilum]MBP0015749.1 cobyrinate a,c-diamide synthase [Roseofilum sp. SID3]MBP0025801.1 cobyrinate a,c-diamide synthase [Roseofilum sp. SID2]MBP0037327.1 cobyrinate a,c-diamide synthase [Roseofilum sp. SID1]MBP0041299.1 cobyrinate a,c-diamide synthase [Roseofilum sp. SBFL]
MGLIIAGDRSGVGKTTITLALLASLREQGVSVQSFKVGPDYIDPMFHTYITGRPCRNLDPVLTSPEWVKTCYLHHGQTADCAVVEGVMGLFDGLPYNCHPDDRHFGSTAHVAKLLNLPVMLVLDCGRMSNSVAAIAHGFQTFDPSLNLAGIVLNRVGSDRHQEYLEAALEPLNLPILGVFPRQTQITIPDRHLGLIPTAELPQLNEILDRLAHLGKHHFNWQKLQQLLKIPRRSGDFEGSNALDKNTAQSQASNPSTPTLFPIPYSLFPSAERDKPKVRLAIAQDPAFSFYYADNLDLLQHLGVELVPWSPIGDRTLPPAIDGLYFGGGFPEMFAEQLWENQPVRNAIYQAILAGLPTYAECGGLMVLCQDLTTFEGKTWEMVGILPSHVILEKKLTLGYRKASTLHDSPLVAAGTTLQGHEFHRSQLTPPFPSIEDQALPLFQLKGYDRHTLPVSEGWQIYNLHASYLHLHWGDRWDIPQRFVQKMLAIREGSR